MPPPQVYLFFSNSGGGHHSATIAICAALDEILASQGLTGMVNISTDTVVEKSHPINRAFVAFYNYLLRNNQSAVKHYFKFIHFMKPNDSALGYQLTGPYLKEIISQARPKVIVAVHPMINQYLPRVISECGLAGVSKLITVVTDPNDRFWRGWACPDGDLTVVPNKLAKERLLSWGVPEHKLKVVGMPIHPQFTRPASVSKEQLLLNLGLNPDLPTICINAGWAGGGNMVAIYRALKNVKRPLQAVFLCGHNQVLYERVSELSTSLAFRTVVMPFYECMSELMNAVDLMVTKAGGLTSFEAIARRLPMAIDLITEPMPQEAGNVDILLSANLAKPIRKPADIVEMVESIDMDENRYAKPLPDIYDLNKTGAAAEIAKIILEYALSGSGKPVPQRKGAHASHSAQNITASRTVRSQ